MTKNLLFIVLLFSSIHSMAQNTIDFGKIIPGNFGTYDFLINQAITTDRGTNPHYYGMGHTVTSEGVENEGIFANYSDEHFVDGYLARGGFGKFVYPVGDHPVSGPAKLRLLTIYPSNANDVFAISWNTGDPSTNIDSTDLLFDGGIHPITAMGTGISKVSPIGWFDWQVGDVSLNGAGMPFSIVLPDMSGFATADKLRLVGWNFVDKKWQNLSGLQGANGLGANGTDTLGGFMADNISAIGIGAASLLLDVKLSNFNVNVQDCNANITWVSSYEDGSTNFTIEQSTDGLSFKAIGQLAAIHPGAGGNYHFIASQNSDVNYYYRLKMVNGDGTYTYSSIRTLVTKCGISANYMTLYPNPAVAVSEATLRFKVNYVGKSRLIVTNNLGQQLMSEPATIVAGENLLHFKIATLAVGAYYVRLIDASGNVIGSTQKLIKQ